MLKNECNCHNLINMKSFFRPFYEDYYSRLRTRFQRRHLRSKSGLRKVAVPSYRGASLHAHNPGIGRVEGFLRKHPNLVKNVNKVADAGLAYVAAPVARGVLNVRKRLEGPDAPMWQPFGKGLGFMKNTFRKRPRLRYRGVSH